MIYLVSAPYLSMPDEDQKSVIIQYFTRDKEVINLLEPSYVHEFPEDDIEVALNYAKEHLDAVVPNYGVENITKSDIVYHKYIDIRSVDCKTANEYYVYSKLCKIEILVPSYKSVHIKVPYDSIELVPQIDASIKELVIPYLNLGLSHEEFKEIVKEHCTELERTLEIHEN